MQSTRSDLNGATMGTRWHLAFYGAVPPGLPDALQQAVDRIDAQMSLWKPDSDICRLNAAEVGAWVPIGPEIETVLRRALEIGQQTGWASGIAVGASVRAWGFGPQEANPDQMVALMSQPHIPAGEALDLDHGRARRMAPVQFDLNGIAKGFGVDRLVEVAQSFGIGAMVAELDGDLRVIGTRPDGTLWPVMVEAPDYDRRSGHSMLELSDVAVATSGDYRHWVTVGDRRLSHTMNPKLHAPLADSPASVTVLAPDGMTADAWATALMVLGVETGRHIARANGIQAMFLERA